MRKFQTKTVSVSVKQKLAGLKTFLVASGEWFFFLYSTQLPKLSPDIIGSITGMAIKSIFSNLFLTKYSLSEMTPETITVNPRAIVAIGNYK